MERSYSGIWKLLNGKYIKGVILIFLELLINIKANINLIIISSFYGMTELAVKQTNYEWLMFYPCVYLLAIWDAFRDGLENKSPLLFLPFAVAAYFETVGVVFSRTFRINGVLLGPIFLPMICIFIGLGIGFIIRTVILRIFLLANNELS